VAIVTVVVVSFWSFFLVSFHPIIAARFLFACPPPSAHSNSCFVWMSRECTRHRQSHPSAIHPSTRLLPTCLCDFPALVPSSSFSPSTRIPPPAHSRFSPRPHLPPSNPPGVAKRVPRHLPDPRGTSRSVFGAFPLIWGQDKQTPFVKTRGRPGDQTAVRIYEGGWVKSLEPKKNPEKASVFMAGSITPRMPGWLDLQILLRYLEARSLDLRRGMVVPSGRPLKKDVPGAFAEFGFPKPGSHSFLGVF